LSRKSKDDNAGKEGAGGRENVGMWEVKQDRTRNEQVVVNDTDVAKA
jgi:hypothetical protein